MRNRLAPSLAALGLLLAACGSSTDSDDDAAHGMAGTSSSAAGTAASGAAGRGGSSAGAGGSTNGMTSSGGTGSGLAGRAATAGTTGAAGAPAGGTLGAGGNDGGASSGDGGRGMGGIDGGGRMGMGGRVAMGGRMAMGGLGGLGGRGEGGAATAGTFSVWMGGATGTSNCPANGHVTYTLTKSANPSATEQMYYDLITEAMDKAVAYYNCYTNITKAETVTYNSGVDTADGNSNGSIRFGGKDYMEYITAMHEIAHTVGVGTVPQWAGFIVNGIFTGEHATAQLRAITGKPDDQVHGDSQHFWPYGLNYTSEVMSEADVIDHCYMVVALRADMELN